MFNPVKFTHDTTEVRSGYRSLYAPSYDGIKFWIHVCITPPNPSAIHSIVSSWLDNVNQENENGFCCAAISIGPSFVIITIHCACVVLSHCATSNVNAHRIYGIVDPVTTKLTPLKSKTKDCPVVDQDILAAHVVVLINSSRYRW